MGSGKSKSKLGPETPVIEAARLSMRKRLRALERAIPRAHDCEPGDDRPIHQLRVATRRAGATLRSFSDLIPAEHAKPIKKQLRKIRRAAGPARIADVHTLQFRAWYRDANAVLRPAIAYILGRLREERAAEQIAIRTVTTELTIDAIRSLRRTLNSQLQSGTKKSSGAASQTLHDYTIRMLPALADRAQEVSRRMSTIDDMHAFRIEGKRLRYAIESLAPAIPDHADDALERLTTLQKYLGELNDAAELLARINAYHADLENIDLNPQLLDALAIVQHGMNRRLNAKRDAFLTWWGDRGIHWLLAPVRDACKQQTRSEDDRDASGRIDADHERAAG